MAAANRPRRTPKKFVIDGPAPWSIHAERGKGRRKASVPKTFEQLVVERPPQAVQDDAQLASTIGTIDDLMALGRLTRGQELYLETLVQLVQAYEAAHHEIEVRRGIPALRHLLDAHGLTGSDLARLLGVHPSMGSKVLRCERSLTVDHIKRLAEHFNVRPEVFLD